MSESKNVADTLAEFSMSLAEQAAEKVDEYCLVNDLTCISEEVLTCSCGGVLPDLDSTDENDTENTPPNEN
eukprot:CAMPEP_0194270674 /NCGR_PEP_ID=MMETSP0169-20130528/4618_1 /TAXON_ID=218684 /ORGANISM="Corethron pennatum, Strain L29A3" /LENGTH=70 /DNA_ID=CAMNT_0039012801 /DNA_START=147 /DNA_END=359 /DNA_ORIENTATION=+